MNCRDVQDAILESFDDGLEPPQARDIAAHLAGCPTCAAFAARQRVVDARLAAAFPASASSPGPAFRAGLRERIRRESAVVDAAPPRAWTDVLPDLVHFASCGAATLLCALLVPPAAPAIVGGGLTAALITYVLLTTVRNSLEDVEQSDR